MNNELLVKFIEKKTGIDVKEIRNVDVKDEDDEYGQAGEHYVVSCVTKFENYFSDNENDTEVEIETFNKKCLIRVDDYERYLKSINSIIWLD